MRKCASFAHASVENIFWCICQTYFSPGLEVSLVVEQIFNFVEQSKYVSWKTRQGLKNLSGFQEPFSGFFEGKDLWPEGAPEEYYQSLES